MTSVQCLDAGSARCFEALQKIHDTSEFKYIVNIQGDEPLIDSQTIDLVAELVTRQDVQVRYDETHCATS